MLAHRVRNEGMKIQERFTQSFSKNPLTWVFGGLFILSVYFHYQTGAEFTRVCRTIVELEEGYFYLESMQKLRATGIDMDAILIKAKEHEELMKTDSPEGRAYRWWRKKVGYISKACGNRLAEPDRRDY